MSLSIETSGLSLDYKDTRALDDVSLSIEPGRIVGLLGRNGSGKTSLVSLLAAFRRQTAGTVRVGGQEPFENPEVVPSICLIRESGDVCDTNKVKDTIRFAARHRRNWDDALAQQLLEKYRIPEKKRVQALSRGMRSALGVILGMASRAPLTIFDEVHLGMDAPSRYTFYETLLDDYLAHPRSIILSTHLIEEVAHLLEDVVIIDEGRLVLHDSAEDLRERGVSITGPAEKVSEFSADLTILNKKELGSTLQVTTYGALDEPMRAKAKAAGLELGAVPLQDLFVHLTDGNGTGMR